MRALPALKGRLVRSLNTEDCVDVQMLANAYAEAIERNDWAPACRALEGFVTMLSRVKGLTDDERDLACSHVYEAILLKMQAHTLSIDIAYQTRAIIEHKVLDQLRARTKYLDQFIPLEAIEDMPQSIRPMETTAETMAEVAALQRLRAERPEAVDALIYAEQTDNLTDAKQLWQAKYYDVTDANFRKIRERARKQLRNFRNEERNNDV
jgi:tRNA A37 N6-isopentenylltransferase MiaA